MEQAENTIYSNPQEAIRIAKYIKNNTENPQQLTHASYLLAASFYIEGKLDEALKMGLQVQKDNNKKQTDKDVKRYVLLSKIMKELELNKLAKKYATEAINLSENIKNEAVHEWLKGKILQYNTVSNGAETSQQNMKRLYKAKAYFKNASSRFQSVQIGNINLDIAAIQLREFQLDSVSYYLEAAYSQSKAANPGNYLEMKSLQLYGNYLFLQKKHKAAIDSLKAAMRIAEKFTHIAEQIAISEAIAENYLALNDLVDFKNQNAQTQNLNNLQTDIDNDAVNVAFNFISENEAEKLTNARANLQRNAVILGSVFLLVVLLWSYLVFRYRIKTKQYKNYIGYFEKKQKSEPAIPSKKEIVKHSVVPKETEEKILEKLNAFEKSTEFTKQEMSLSLLALQFETNTKYLSEVVNFNKQKNFNAYINELRINYIIEKLKTDPAYLQYKISYLAQDSGFTSHSLFATVFKSVTGIPPTAFITILKDKTEQLNTTQT
ncbi:AraC family transcriptional regulator [Aequorivita sp. F47161]|uniref:AraC family transcriptional regulator n=1 Tax=Aequorivita vitellina TaxID=2874475 RepID=A0A9X1QYK1_9FLAO|nr:AraC family transcriptional regulator [Aequorivita vitellina]MCG2420226.1 AraC family transcriptional regulator [Aequorivita vitellina]